MKNKITDIVNKIKEIYAEVYRSYPVSMIMVNLTMVLGIAYVLMDYSASIVSTDIAYRVIEWLTLFFLYLTFGCFGSENLTNRLARKIGIAGTAVISAVLVSLNLDYIFGIFETDMISVSDNRLIAFNLAYFILIVLSSFYNRYKESELSIEKYFVYVFVQIIQTCIAWAILALGFLLLSLAFETLIDVMPGEVEIPQILIIGLFVAPRMFMSLTPANHPKASDSDGFLSTEHGSDSALYSTKVEIGRFFEILIKYVLLIITIAGAAIIYLYMIKLIFTRLPSNEIFAITSALFFAAIPVGFACTAFARDSFLQKIAYVLPYIYAPFIILQAYSIVVRIAEYGVTPSRYAGIVLIVLEILYTVMYAFYRQHIDKLILAMMAVTVVATLIPGINAIDFSRMSQKNIVKAFAQNGIPDTQEGMKKIQGAYNYILDECGEAYVNGILSSELQNQIAEFKIDNNTIGLYGLRSDLEIIPTKGYEYVADFNAAVRSFDSERDISQMELRVDGRTLGTFDFTDEYNSIIERCLNNDGKYITTYDTIKVSDDCELIITFADIYEDTEDGYICEFRINGSILMNQSWLDENNSDVLYEQIHY